MNSVDLRGLAYRLADSRRHYFVGARGPFAHNLLDLDAKDQPPAARRILDLLRLVDGIATGVGYRVRSLGAVERSPRMEIWEETLAAFREADREEGSSEEATETRIGNELFDASKGFLRDRIERYFDRKTIDALTPFSTRAEGADASQLLGGFELLERRDRLEPRTGLRIRVALARLAVPFLPPHYRPFPEKALGELLVLDPHSENPPERARKAREAIREFEKWGETSASVEESLARRTIRVALEGTFSEIRELFTRLPKRLEFRFLLDPRRVKRMVLDAIDPEEIEEGLATLKLPARSV